MGRIALLIPDLPRADDILPYLREIDSAKRYTNFGPLAQRLERLLAQQIGPSMSQVAMVANCTLGLELSLQALVAQKGANVLVPALTFVATATAVSRAGFTAVLSDVDDKSWVLTPEIARRAAAQYELACVVAVAAYGYPHAPQGWDAFTRDTGIPVLIDAAGAFGNQLVGQTAVVAYSFHATKALGIGEGGLVAARNESFVSRIRQLANFGIDTTVGRSQHIGTNAKFSEYHAAVGLAAMETWKKTSDMRRGLHRYYISRLAALCPDVGLQARPLDGIYAILQVNLPRYADRGKVVSYLEKNGIETRAWYLPLISDHPAFSRSVGETPEVARALAQRILGLPFHTYLDDQDVDRVCLALAEALRASF